VPFLLFGRKFWETIINWDALSKAGTISADDIDLFRFVDTADEAMECMDNWHLPATKRDGIPGR
jgi:predicted Rossmann-fold nucleotide-binding protein